MAFQSDSYQNFTTHGTKGFQTTPAAAADEYTTRWHHFYAAWLLALAVDLWTRWAR